MFIKRFKNRDKAYGYMVMKNRTSKNETFCLVDGPENDYGIVDLDTAIDLGGPYEWSCK